MEKSLQELLLLAFTPLGEVRLCGRETCKKLITQASIAYTDIEFGNPNTGMMNVESFREFFFSNS